jgi:hypothetical protein
LKSAFFETPRYPRCRDGALKCYNWAVIFGYSNI